MGEHKFVAIDPDNLYRAAVVVEVAHFDFLAARLRAAADAAFTVEDVKRDMGNRATYSLLIHSLARRLQPPVKHDHKGYSEEKCERCGWVMGHPPLNCQNDNTPHRFPSQHLDGSGR